MSRLARVRRVQVDVPLYLSVTLEGQADECSKLFAALVADAAEAVQQLARRDYLRADRGESITARLPAECNVTDLPPRAGSAPGAAAAAPTSGGRPALRLVRGGAARRDQRGRPAGRVKP
jgi:hypothetical protein